MVQKYIRGHSAVKIAADIERAIQRGRLAPGATLPTVRALAEDLRVSPTTVAAAYKALRQRGLVHTAGRRGTRVSDRPALVSRPPPPLPEGVLNLADGNPDPALLPDLRPVLAKLRPPQRLYGEDANRAELVALAGRLPPKADLAIVSGALDGIERVFLAHLRPGDRVAVEDPGFPDVSDLARALGLETVPVAVDDRGLEPDALAAALRRGVDACVLTPRAQNPTGAALDRARARALREVLNGYPDVLLIEDDHAGPIAGAPAITLCGAPRARWAVVRSVSKYLGPDLRLAFLKGDENTVARVEGRQRLGTSWVSHILQECVLKLLLSQKTKALLNRATRAYARRRNALLRALVAQGIEGHGRSGLNVWIPVTDETRTVQALLEAGWAVAPGERFRARSAPAIRVTVAALPVRQAPRFARALARILSAGERTHVA